MAEIVLTEEQTHVLRHAGEQVSIRDPQGDLLAVIDPLDIEALRRHRERRNQPRGKGIPMAKVKEHFVALEAEWQRTGGFDAAYAKEFLKKLREQDGS